MSNNALRSHYDKKYEHEASAASHSVISDWRNPNDRFKAAVAAMHRHFHGGRILEIGAGDGVIARTLLHSELGIVEYTVTDWSESRVCGLAASFSDRRVNTLQLDAENIPSELAGRFDAVLMVALLEHLVDPMAAMRNIAALLRPGGFVYIDTPNIAKWTRRLKLLAGRFPSTAATNEGLLTYGHEPVTLYDEGHLHYFTLRSLSKMLCEYCGFSRTLPCGYWFGTFALGSQTGSWLAQRWPALFSDVALVAYA